MFFFILGGAFFFVFLVCCGGVATFVIFFGMSLGFVYFVGVYVFATGYSAQDRYSPDSDTRLPA